MVKRPWIASSIRDRLVATLSREDLTILVTQMVGVAEHGEVPSEIISFTDVAGLGFPCREAAVNLGTKGIGLLSFYSMELAEDELVVLFAKEGAPGNLSIQERNIIREVYRKEMEQRGLKP